MTTVRTDIRGREVVMTFLSKDRWSVEVDGKNLGSRFVSAAACVMAAARHVSAANRMQSAEQSANMRSTERHNGD